MQAYAHVFTQTGMKPHVHATLLTHRKNLYNIKGLCKNSCEKLHLSTTFFFNPRTNNDYLLVVLGQKTADTQKGRAIKDFDLAN